MHHSIQSVVHCRLIVYLANLNLLMLEPLKFLLLYYVSLMHAWSKISSLLISDIIHSATQL